MISKSYIFLIYGFFLLMSIALSSFFIGILYFIRKYFFSPKESKKIVRSHIDYTDLDLDKIAIKLYNKFFLDLNNRSFLNFSSYCSLNCLNDICNVNFDNIKNCFIKVDSYLLTKEDEFFEYLFVSFDVNNVMRRTVMKFCYVGKKFIVESVGDEK